MVQPFSSAYPFDPSELSEPWRTPVSQGWSVFRLPLGKKEPGMPWKRYQSEHPSHDQLHAWGRTPSNIAIVTGMVSGLVVLDLDSPAARKEAERRGLPVTIRSKTGKGEHVFLQHPGGNIPNRAGIFDGADIRGEGGYVVAPGSRHPDGGTYAWINHPDSTPLAAMPPWLTDLLNQPGEHRGDKAAPDQAKAIPTDIEQAACQAMVDVEMQCLRNTPEGQRNDTLNKVVYTVTGLAAGHGFDLAPVLAEIRQVALEIGLDPQEIDATVRSARTGGGRAPLKPLSLEFRSASGSATAQQPPGGWRDPEPLPSSLSPVASFDLALLPTPFRPWVADISERMQVPAEFVAVPAMIGAASVIGNRVGVRPMRQDDWHVVANIWGLIIGRPGVMKSPSVSAALAPLARLETIANEKFEQERKEWERDQFVREIRNEARRTAIKRVLNGDPNADVADLIGDADEAPVCMRYRSNDGSYQAIGELLRQNPRGLLYYRDELMSLLHALDREDNSEARGFYLSAWNGSDSYVFDRIGRGMNLYISQVTLSMLGSTQPGKLGEYVRRVVRGGASDDGMLQRFSMAVWPDLPSGWREVDRAPDSAYRRRAFDTFDRLDKLESTAIGAVEDELRRGAPYLRFDPEAQEVFAAWRARLEHRLRGEGLHAAMESHLAKYRKLVPALSLVHHLAESVGTAIGVASVIAAIGWAEFLESHAHRIYHSGMLGDVAGAQTILKNLRVGRLETPFKAREIGRRGWSPIGDDMGRVQAAIDLLEDHKYLFGEQIPTGLKGGRPTYLYHVNPKLFAR